VGGWAKSSSVIVCKAAKTSITTAVVAITTIGSTSAIGSIPDTGAPSGTSSTRSAAIAV
jgi:hypothetical protein